MRATNAERRSAARSILNMPLPGVPGRFASGLSFREIRAEHERCLLARCHVDTIQFLNTRFITSCGRPGRTQILLRYHNRGERAGALRPWPVPD